ncbi:MAG TPA: hypothetical protein PLP50_02000 [Thermoanaerobaculia bacterium]|nr:hypothetical protein [Thermoanaerobaculia bacterium]
MIAFVTLFLGLFYGPAEIELSAAPGVARIELYVDGDLVSELTGPWVAKLDLGPEIVPRELVAVAKDAEGQRVGEVRQWVNRPRPGAEASFVVEKDPGGAGRTARLLWRSVTRSEAKSIRVTFDGLPLDVPDPSRIPLPAHSAGTTHILVADVDFEDGLSATAVASLGGEKLDEALEELTAVPIRLARGGKLPKDGRLEGWFRAGGEPLKVAAVEEGPSNVVFVVAGRALDDLHKLIEEVTRERSGLAVRAQANLPVGARYRFVETIPRVVRGPEEVASRFFSSEDYSAGDDYFFSAIRKVAPGDRPGEPRVADAVAISGLSAAEKSRRRAVVLLLGSGATDAGPITAERARRCLSKLGVPLHVWDVSRPPAKSAKKTAPRPPGPPNARSHWPEAVRVSGLTSLLGVFRSLEKDLSSQRIVWLKGRLNPAKVELTASAEKGVSLVP